MHINFSINGSHCIWKIESPDCLLGLATGITQDGYLITAAHAAKPHCGVLGWMEGKLATARARVVYKKSFGEPGAEFAILHIENHIDNPLRLEPLKSDQKQVYALASELGPNGRLIVLAGQILNQSKVGADEGISVISTNLPTQPGDSGGAVLSPNGNLIGLNTGFNMPWLSFKVFHTACAPSKELVMSIIERDRQESKKSMPISKPN
ncbi:MAG: serine protease [Methylacidiphilales bacterium]|nr:serine protease [Candidatus Methylacidiphilales bacterium]